MILLSVCGSICGAGVALWLPAGRCGSFPSALWVALHSSPKPHQNLTKTSPVKLYQVKPGRWGLPGRLVFQRREARPGSLSSSCRLLGSEDHSVFLPFSSRIVSRYSAALFLSCFFSCLIKSIASRYSPECMTGLTARNL